MEQQRNSVHGSQNSRMPNSKIFLTSFFAGAGAGAIAKTTIAPLDRAKIFFQSTQEVYTTRSLLVYLRNTVVNEGLLILWRGNTATMARILPYSAVRFASHEQYKRLFHVDTSKKVIRSLSYENFLRFVCGALAGITSVSATYPLDCMRTRMAVTEKRRYVTLMHTMKTVFKEEGFIGLYRGFTPAILGSIPYAGFAFFTYEIQINSIKQITERPDITPYERALCGGTAGIIAQISSYPLDVARRKMQTAHILNHPEYSESIRKTLKIVLEKEGFVHGWFKGLSMNWFKGPIASAISFTAFDILQKTFRKLT